MKKYAFSSVLAMTFAASVYAGLYVDDGVLAKKDEFPSVVKIVNTIRHI